MATLSIERIKKKKKEYLQKHDFYTCIQQLTSLQVGLHVQIRNLFVRLCVPWVGGLTSPPAPLQIGEGCVPDEISGSTKIQEDSRTVSPPPKAES